MKASVFIKVFFIIAVMVAVLVYFVKSESSMSGGGGGGGGSSSHSYSDVKNIRNLIIGDFNIFYETKSQTIEIVTIWDSRQDPSKLVLK
jgi:hypothetical protein